MSRKSEHLFQSATAVLPGGVNSPVRAFNAVGGHPVYFNSGQGAWLTDVDGKRYVDYVGAWGPAILGHGDSGIQQAIATQLQNGISFGGPSALETELAETIVELLPHAEKVRMVNSGTEAAMTAIRLARGATGRERIVKFEGCYHGHADSLLVKAGSGALTMGVPTSPGVPEGLAQLTSTLSFNDADGVREAFKHLGDSVAAIIVEPVAGNMNCVPPQDGFLETLRELSRAHGALLIFDEVMTGFRSSLNCYQSVCGIKPDLTVLGKVIGGGMPVGAIAGPAQLMDQLAPDGPIYQAGTLSGNPLAMASGLAALKAIQADGFFDKIHHSTQAICAGLEQQAQKHGIPFLTNHVCGMFGMFFTDQRQVTSFAEVMQCDADRFRHFFHGMLEQGVNFAPSAFEAGFVSAAHDNEAINHTLDAAGHVFSQL